MVILLDLDGTITNTVHPGWKAYKDGISFYPVDNIPFFDGAIDFIQHRRNRGDKLLIASDSHPNFVIPIAEKLNLPALSLCNKPNTNKLRVFLNENNVLPNEPILFVGDSTLDVELGRRIGARTAWLLPYHITEEIVNVQDGIGDTMSCVKMGPTYSIKTYHELNQIIESPNENLYVAESLHLGSTSIRPIVFSENSRVDGTCSSIYCLGRQEQGLCDDAAIASLYYEMQRKDRSEATVNLLAKSVSFFLNQDCFSRQNWDYLSYINDKTTTIPKNKLKDIFEKIETRFEKKELFYWGKEIDGSLRKRESYTERRTFLENNLSVKDIMQIAGKNIIVLDDQLTTGATAWFVIQKLKDAGAKNIMFIAIFQMILNVFSEKHCPICGKQLYIKINRTNGKRFYSCLSPVYGGNGCGHIENII